MGYLNVEGDRRLYVEHHRGEGAPVVLIHGWGVTGRCWDTTLPALLANGNEVVILDQRCCGKSDKDFEDLSIDALGSDVVSVVRELGCRRPVLNGWSLGGAVAADAAAKLGDDLGGLVLTGGASPRFTQGEDWPWGDTVEGLEGTLAAVRDNRPLALRGVAEAVCHADVGEPAIAWMWSMFMETSPLADRSLRDLGEVDQREQFTRIHAPALVLCGRHDAFVAYEAAARAAELLRDARFVGFEDSGHAPFIEEGERYRSELIGFVNGI